jgi:hypothetical protein
LFIHPRVSGPPDRLARRASSALIAPLDGNLHRSCLSIRGSSPPSRLVLGTDRSALCVYRLVHTTIDGWGDLTWLQCEGHWHAQVRESRPSLRPLLVHLFTRIPGTMWCFETLSWSGTLPAEKAIRWPSWPACPVFAFSSFLCYNIRALCWSPWAAGSDPFRTKAAELCTWHGTVTALSLSLPLSH